MRGVSEVIAIILILMITIAIAGLAYTFMSSTMASTTSAASSAVDSTTSSMLTSFTIESMDVAKVYIRNTGHNALSNLSVYVNDEPAIYNITPATITTGQVGTITIYSFIPDGATIKLTSINGFSASNVANLCGNAAGCWKFDEESGTIAYDGSHNGNSGVVSGAIWTTGKYGKALQFDGVNDYVNCGNSSVFNYPTQDFSIGAWFKTNANGSIQTIARKGLTGFNPSYFLRIETTGNLAGRIFDGANEGYTSTPSTYNDGIWHYAVMIVNRTAQRIYLYVDGVFKSQSGSTSGVGSISTPLQLTIGSGNSADFVFNGTIDDARIYNRAIY